MGSNVKKGVINNKYCTFVFNFLLYNLKMSMVAHKEQEIISQEIISLYTYLHRYIATYIDKDINIDTDSYREEYVYNLWWFGWAFVLFYCVCVSGFTLPFSNFSSSLQVSQHQQKICAKQIYISPLILLVSTRTTTFLLLRTAVINLMGDTLSYILYMQISCWKSKHIKT